MTQTRFCCRHGPDVAWRQHPAGVAVADAGGGLADADEPGGHDRIGGERAARRVHDHVVGEAQRVAQDQLLVRERRVQLGDVDRCRRRRRRAAGHARSTPMSRGRARRARAPRCGGRSRGSRPAGVHGLRARSPAASTTAAAPSVIGGQSCGAAARRAWLGEERVDRRVAGDDARSGSTSPPPGCAPRPRPCRARVLPLASRYARPAAPRATPCRATAARGSTGRAAAS